MPNIVSDKEQNKDSFKVITGRNEVVAKVIFLHLFVILFTGGGWCAWSGGVVSHKALRQTPPGQAHTPPSGPDTPPPSDQTHHPPRPGTHPLDQTHTPPDQTPPPGPGTPSPPDQTHLPPEADSGIRSTSGRYTSYRNTFLFKSKNSPEESDAENQCVI